MICLCKFLRRQNLKYLFTKIYAILNLEILHEFSSHVQQLVQNISDLIPAYRISYALILALQLLNHYKSFSHGKLSNFGVALPLDVLNLHKIGNHQYVLKPHVINFLVFS
jgi:hypothetical protein